MVVVIECKADITKHESKDYNRPAEYAVDGVLHYARWLSPKYTVIAIAVSGNEKGSLMVHIPSPQGRIGIEAAGSRELVPSLMASYLWRT